MTVTAVVADAGKSSRERLRTALRADGAVEVVAEVAQCDELRDVIHRTAPAVVVIEGEMAIEAVALVPAPWTGSDTEVLALIDDVAERDIVALVEGGVRGFVRRGSNDLVRATLAVAASEVAVDPILGARLMPVLLQVNADRLAASAALELARESLAAQIGELLETNASLTMARESLAAHLGEMLDTYRETVRTLAAAVELRDPYTGGHIERVAAYALALSQGFDPVPADDPSVLGYMLHDVGKLSLPDEVLFNTGSLTPAQFDVVKTHTVTGSRLVDGIPFLRPALHIVRNHHERWDGKGYPDGLAGEEIPLIVRVFSVADALDAITTDRPYQKARSLEFAVSEITTEAGTQFDPVVATVFAEVVATDPAFESLRQGRPAGRGEGES